MLFGRQRKRVTHEGRIGPGACFLGEQQSACGTESLTSYASGAGVCFHAMAIAAYSAGKQTTEPAPRHYWPPLPIARSLLSAQRKTAGLRAVRCVWASKRVWTRAVACAAEHSPSAGDSPD